ncbi:hypothetical protein [Streptomyces sp. NPDC001876]|uniref:hypothetical protein n=1 Tax=Streptomyces sp. NPDC001876 TaxID=3154402 RepID=UPI0033236AA7
MTVEAYWDKSDEELYSLLGAELLGEGLGLSPEDQENHRRFGKQWFANKHSELQRKICHHEKTQGLLGTTGSDRLIDAFTIHELLTDLDDDPTTAALIAVLVARVGLGTFCRTSPAPS